MSKKKYTYIDLFAGAGGLSEGFLAQGDFIPLAHVEMNKYAAETLKTRTCYYYLKEHSKQNTYWDYLKGNISREQLFQSVPNELLSTIINKEISSSSISGIFQSIDRTINQQHITGIDLIIGGPPCQAYSLMGRAVDAKNMKKDPRNYLYKQYIKFLLQYRPKAFVFENVPGILTAGKGKRFKQILGAFRTAGYNIEYHVLDAFDYGVLQQRKRVIIFGWRGDLTYSYPQPRITHYNVTTDVLFHDLCPLAPGEERNQYRSGRISSYVKDTGIRKPGEPLTLHLCRMHNNTDLAIYYRVIEAWNNGHTRLRYSDLPEDLRTRKNQTSFVDRYKVVAGDLPYSHTMIAHISKDGHYFIHPDINQCRSISVREAARIQSFPDDFYFEGPRSAKFTQIGNAVPPLMAKALADAIAQIFDKEGAEQL